MEKYKNMRLILDKIVKKSSIVIVWLTTLVSVSQRHVYFLESFLAKKINLGHRLLLEILCANYLVHSSFSRSAFLADLTDLEVDFYCLLLFVLIIWQSTHKQTHNLIISTGNIK